MQKERTAVKHTLHALVDKVLGPAEKDETNYYTAAVDSEHWTSIMHDRSIIKPFKQQFLLFQSNILHISTQFLKLNSRYLPPCYLYLCSPFSWWWTVWRAAIVVPRRQLTIMNHSRCSKQLQTYFTPYLWRWNQCWRVGKCQNAD